jgi:hypothetical protein
MYRWRSILIRAFLMTLGPESAQRETLLGSVVKKSYQTPNRENNRMTSLALCNGNTGILKPLSDNNFIETNSYISALSLSFPHAPLYFTLLVLLILLVGLGRQYGICELRLGCARIQWRLLKMKLMQEHFSVIRKGTLSLHDIRSTG